MFTIIFDDEDGVFRKTLGEMKEKLYNDLIELVSHKNDYLHTQGILNSTTLMKQCTSEV